MAKQFTAGQLRRLITTQNLPWTIPDSRMMSLFHCILSGAIQKGCVAHPRFPLWT